MSSERAPPSRRRSPRPLGLGVLEAAAGIVEVVNAGMAGALRIVSVERGHDPRDFTLVAFGGAGPVHAARLAEELEIPRVLVPPIPGGFSALGLVATDVRRDYARTFYAALPSADPAEHRRRLRGHGRRGARDAEPGRRAQGALGGHARRPTAAIRARPTS